jgi:hypothetical protein
MNEFNSWIRNVINPQARHVNSISLDDYTRNGMTEYLYPKTFLVNGVEFRWSFGSRKTRGKGMSSHYELWLHANDWSFHEKIATGEWTLGKTRKGLRMIYDRLHSTNGKGA